MRPRHFVELFPADLDPTRLEAFNGVALDTLAQWHILAAWCKTCGRVSVLNRHLMIKEMGNQYLRHLEPKLKCGACKKRGAKFLLGQQSR